MTTQLHALIALLFMAGIGLGLAGQRWWWWRKQANHWQNVAIHYHRKTELLEDELRDHLPSMKRCAPPGTATIIPFRNPKGE